MERQRTDTTWPMTADAHEGSITPATDRLLLDVMLGKLVVYLRMGGYDAAYVGDREVETDEEIRSLARSEDRVLLSRDVDLVTPVADAVLLTEREPADQLDELRAAGFELALSEVPTRCGRCNGPLEPVSADEPRPAYAPPPAAFDCWRCADCGQFFWKGSHWDRVASLL